MNRASKPLFKNLIQVGMVVSDLKKSMEKYIYDFGIGPMYVMKFSSSNVSNMCLHGKRKDYSMNLGVCSIGDVRFELIEPIDGSIYSEYYSEYGEGIIHHLKLGVDNYFDTLEYLRSIGVKTIQSGHQLGDRGKNMYTYLDTRESLGFIIEIVNITKDFIKPDPDYWFPENKKDIPRSLFKRPDKVGIVVKDLSKKIEQYSNLFGLKSWNVKRFNSSNVSNMYVYEKKRNYSVNIGFCYLGNVQFKLIEALNESIYSDFYNKYSEGVVHHIGMEVDDYDKTLEFLKSKGFKVMQTGNYLEKVKYSYLFTSSNPNFIIEIAENKEPIYLLP